MSIQRFSTGARFVWQEDITKNSQDISQQVGWHPYEVKRLLPEGQVSLENMQTGAIRIERMTVLVKALFDGTLRFVTYGKRSGSVVKGAMAGGTTVSLADYPEHLIVVARRRLEAIRSLVDLEPGKRTREAVEARVREIRAEEQNSVEAQHSPRRDAASVPSLYRWIKDYTEHGYDLQALIPATGRCGGKRKPRIDSAVNAVIESVIQDRYYIRERVTIDDILHEVATRIDEENKYRSAGEELTVPSRGTVARRIDALDLSARLVARRGKRVARLELSQYGQTKRPAAPLERVEIDHTRPDVIVVDERDNLPLGRPTLTFCLDIATCYPLGYYLGFEPPSYLAVMECLYHAIRPKENTKEKFGTDHDWIAYGIPNTLVIDNGKEFIGRDLQDACLLLGMVLQQTPVATPYFKPGVERLFGTTNTMLLHTLPGTTFSNPHERGDYDSVQQAVVWLSELEQMLNIYIVDIYAERFHGGLEGIPARRWEDGVRSGFFSPRLPPSREGLAILLGRVEERVIQKYGIDFESIRYNSPDLAPLRTELKKRGQKAKLKYHPADLSRIHVYDPFNQAYIEVPALDQEYALGLSLWKHRVIRNAVLSEQDTVDLAALGRAKRKIQGIVDAARARKRTSTRTKIARWDAGGKSLGHVGNERFSGESVEAIASLPPPPVTLPAGASGEKLLKTDEPPAQDWEIAYTLPKSRRDMLQDIGRSPGNGQVT